MWLKFKLISESLSENCTGFWLWIAFADKVLQCQCGPAPSCRQIILNKNEIKLVLWAGCPQHFFGRVGSVIIPTG
jgi:hypothetical protein